MNKIAPAHHLAIPEQRPRQTLALVFTIDLDHGRCMFDHPGPGLLQVGVQPPGGLTMHRFRLHDMGPVMVLGVVKAVFAVPGTGGQYLGTAIGTTEVVGDILGDSLLPPILVGMRVGVVRCVQG